MKPPKTYRALAFALDETRDRLLFSDAFITEDPAGHRHLVLVSTYYADMPFDFGEVVVTVDGVRLNRFEDVGRDEHEPMRAIIYPLGYLEERPLHDVEVRWEDHRFSARLAPERQLEAPKFALATLFKDDYANIETCYHHYRQHGVERFYLFYNGDLSRLPEPLFAAPEITYGEWNIRYWLRSTSGAGAAVGGATQNRHHAQVMFLTMLRYRLLAHCSYLALVDLDEFLAVPGEPGVTLREHVESVDAETLTARCFWAEVRNPKSGAPRSPFAVNRARPSARERAVNPAPRITSADLAHVWANPEHEGESRMKTIYRGDFDGFCGVHHPKRPARIHISEELALYHMVNTAHERHNLMSHDAAPVSLL